MIGTSLPTVGRPWWQPTLSHQHGPLVALLVSFLLGAAGSQNWSMGTTAALVVVLMAFQAEHPLVQQIRRRRALQPRLLLWAGLYGALALGLGAVLAWHTPVLIALAGLAAAALGLDALAVLQRRQRGLGHELLAFAAVCLAAPFAWVAGSGSLEPQAMGLWALCSLYFGSSVALLKLRRDPDSDLRPVLLIAGFSLALLLLGWRGELLGPLEAATYGVALLKGGWLLRRLENYRAAPIGRVAAIETGSALLFLLLAALALLPATLPSSG
ncbi:MAG: YwiC-like family protein [Synechococcaceae cyanobacterium]|nr:YwiC-like family protein [Synechococcaceae cyanobacterium]